MQLSSFLPVVLRRGAPTLRLAARLAVLSVLACTGLETPGQEATAKPRTAISVSPSVIQRYTRGHWTSMVIGAANSTETDSEEVVSVFIGDDPSLQYAKQFWVPAGSKRSTWLPVFVPADAAATERHFEMSSIRLKTDGDSEEFTDNYLGMPVSERLLLITDLAINTGVMIDRPSALATTAQQRQREEDLLDTVHIGRDLVASSGPDLGVIDLLSDFLPPTPGALDELDQIVLASNRLSYDTAGLQRIRNWLFDGGRLWITLDQIDDSLVTDLLGDEVGHRVVDRIELNKLDLKLAATGFEVAKEETWESETPVEMVRVVTEATDIPITVNGWPAAFWQPVGHGEVLFTTIGMRGWKNGGAPTQSYLSLARRLFDERRFPPPAAAALAPILDQEIGYQIPSRSIAAMVLGSNAILILVAGCVWVRQRRLERLALLIPVSTLLSAAALMVIGNLQIKSVPSTIATGQVINSLGSTGQARISAMRAIYSRQAGEIGMHAANGTLAVPALGSNQAGTSRIRFDDSGGSTWQGGQQPPGVIRYIQSESTIDLDQPLEVRGSFDAEGFYGTINGLDGKACSDALMVAPPRPATSVQLAGVDQPQVNLRCGINDILSPGQYVPGALLSGDQRLRQQWLREVMADPANPPFGSGLKLLFWTDPVDTGITFPDRFDVRGTALTSASIDLSRPAAGTSYRIPPTFIDLDTFSESTIFNTRTGQWTQMSKPGEVQLAVGFPAELIPLELSELSLVVKILAPSRSMVVKARVDGQGVEMFRKDNPTGRIELSLSAGDSLQLDADNRLWLAIAVTETEFERQNATRPDQPLDANNMPEVVADQADNSDWQIDYVQLSAVATSQ